MASADIFLGPGDTAPITRYVLRGPNKDDGSDGDPLDLSGCTIVFRYQPRDGSVAVASRNVTVFGDPTLGDTELDWLATGGGISPGDYNARYRITFPAGHVLHVPNGDQRLIRGEDSLPAPTFFWMQVAPDFVTVP